MNKKFDNLVLNNLESSDIKEKSIQILLIDGLENKNT